MGVVIVADPSAFLFTLAAKSKVNVVQHKQLSGAKPGVMHRSGYMNIFCDESSGVCDLVVNDNCSSSKTSCGKLGKGFDATGNVIPRWTATVPGDRKFTVHEIEVFQLDCDVCKSSGLSWCESGSVSHK